METNSITALRIGIPIIGNKDWLGGVHYVKSLVEAVNSLPQDERPRIFLVINDQTLNWIDLHRDFFSLLDGVIFFGHNILGAKATLPLPVIHCLTLEELKKALDFFYPLIADVIPDLCSASWIYDFQHVYLPEFFPRDEIQSRDTKFKNVAESARLVVLSSKTAELDFRRIFPGSKAVTRILSFHSLPAENWHVLDSSEIHQKYSLPDKFLICCNQFWIHKNHRCLFEAMAEVVRQAPNTHLVCTGSTSDWRFQDYFAKLTALITKHGLQNRISILGTIPRIDQIQLMRRSMAVIQPSLFEGWSSVVEEARILGKTIILSDLPVHYEQAPGYAVYFDRHSAKDLAEKILGLLPHLSAGPDNAREQEAKENSIDLIRKFGRDFCNIAIEAQELFGKEGGKLASQPLIIQLQDDNYIQETLSNFSQMASQSPESPDLLNMQAEGSYRSGDREEAKKILLDLTGRWPSYAKALNNLGAIYLEEGSDDKAEEYFSRAFQEDPNDKNIVLNAGKMLIRQKQYEIVKQLYRLFLKNKPDVEEVREALENLEKTEA